MLQTADFEEKKSTIFDDFHRPIREQIFEVTSNSNVEGKFSLRPQRMKSSN